jgi:glycosyltransferase involved in cell wall biosynthesis
VTERPRTTWVLPIERMPVSRTSAPQLRVERLGSWLAGMGYDTRSPLAPPGGPGRRGRGTGRALLDAVGWVGAAPWLALRARRERPSVVVAPSVLHGPALFLIRRAHGDALLVVDAMGLRSLEVERTARMGVARALYRPAWRLLERLSFGAADVVIAVNDSTAELIRTRYAHPRVRTVRDAAEAEVADIAPADRASLGVPDGTVAVCFMGSLVCRRLDPLFEAWRSLEREPRLRLVVVGDGPDLERYRRLAGELGNVSLLGALPRERALSVVRACDIAYTGSWSRAGFSFKLFEYLALGMPILVEAKPQMREALRDGDDAVFYTTPEELARKIRCLADDPDLRARLGAAARQTFLSDHTLDARRREFAGVLAEAAA